MRTLLDKIWDQHVVKTFEGGPSMLYIDRHYIHEVTSPQAFKGLKEKGLKVYRPENVVATADHNVPTMNQDQPIKDKLSAMQVATLEANCAEHGIELQTIGDEYQGVVHVMGPELGYTLPGMTIVCGDSHTSTHGAFGAIAFGIGTSQVEQVLATQCLLQKKPKSMRITIDGKLGIGVSAKDVVLYIISQLGTGGGTGHFVEFAGEVFEQMSMEERMTVCNMSIEMGARGGMIAPDETTFNYLANTRFGQNNPNFKEHVNHWKTLVTDEGASFDQEYTYSAEDIQPMLTYGTNPGMGIGLFDTIPYEGGEELTQALNYMGFERGSSLIGQKVDYVFIGSCTNSRIEDLRVAAKYVEGKQKTDGVVCWIVPGSKEVERQAKLEGLDKIFEAAGFQMRQPGCSACLAMNEDKVPAGKLCISTSNRNFEGRQGPGSRTILASPLTAIASAVKGSITSSEEVMKHYHTLVY